MGSLQKRVLEILARQGAINPAAICREGDIPPAGIYATIDRLVGKGLVRKLDRAGPTRDCMLTEAGEKRAAELIKEMAL